MDRAAITSVPASLRQRWRTHILPLAILALVLVVSVIVRVRLLDAPLERDEGEHGYMAQTLLAGYAPWQLAYNLKLPGTDFAYALLLAIFGQTATAIRLGLLLVNIATVGLLALLGKRLFGLAGGVVTGAAYGLLASSQGVLGTIAHSTHFVMFFAVLATLLLIHAQDRAAWLFLASLIYGLAFLMKQPGLAFGAFGLLYVACRWRSLKLIASSALGIALPYAALCLALWKAGVFPRFWFWTVTLARAYAGSISFSATQAHFAHEFPRAVDSNIILWVLGGVGLVFACRNPATRRAGLFTGAFVVFSFLAVAAGGAFNAHYFIMMLPAVALGCGAACGQYSLPAGAAKYAIPCLALACLYSIVLQRDYLFRMTPYEFERSSYGLNPFPEAVTIADYIRVHTDPGARIAVIGSEAEIYFYSHRQAATGYLFTYGLMEPHQYALPSQLEMIHEIESARPDYVVFVGVGTSWMVRPDSSREVFRWAKSYTSRYYDVVGAVNLRTGEPPAYTWGPEAYVYDAASPAYMTVYRRRLERS
jgi:hypothetical protein